MIVSGTHRRSFTAPSGAIRSGLFPWYLRGPRSNMSRYSRALRCLDPGRLGTWMLAQTSCGAHTGSQCPSVSNEKRLVYQLKENLGWCRSWSTLLRLLGPTVCVRGSYRATRPEGRGVIARQRGSYRSDTVSQGLSAGRYPPGGLIFADQTWFLY